MMDWSDIEEIAVALDEAHGEADPRKVLFTQLRDWILALPGFVGPPEHCGERLLEAVQAAWIEERR